MTEHKAPTCDEWGYPTEATLERVRRWPATDLWGLAEYVRQAWRYPERWEVTEKTGWREIHASTSGWSGNELLIIALERNRVFWGLCWQKSARGGHYWVAV